MAGYTEKDLERAFDCLEACGVGTDSLKHINAVAQLIADVRNETIERCAVECEGRGRFGREQAAELRILKDGANAHRPQVVTITPEEAAKVLVARLKPEDGAK